LAVAIMLTFAIVFTRAGVLALIVTHIVERLMVRVPVTLEPAEWYVVGSIVTLTLVAAIAVYGGFASHSDPKRARRPSADHDTLIQTSVVR